MRSAKRRASPRSLAKIFTTKSLWAPAILSFTPSIIGCEKPTTMPGICAKRWLS